MDDRSFDRLARLLGGASDRRAGLKALAGGILGAGGLAALDTDADAKRKAKHRDKDAGPDAERRKRKRRKKCTPACEGGFACVKGTCACPSGVVCEGACCASGKACVAGACADAPDPVTCIAAGEPCKNVGRRCCDGRVCASGQGGDRDVACYVPKTGRCERTSDCVYGMRCRSGRCEPPQPGDLAELCDAAAQQLCITPGAVCTSYTGTGAPDGDFCTLPLRKVCTGDAECTCYRCFYSNATATAGGTSRAGRASTKTRTCCHPPGFGCGADQDCCLGLSCRNGTCTGTMCVPDEAAGCGAATPCCNRDAVCSAGTCLVPAGKPCAADAQCLSGSCIGAVCAADTTERCGTSNNGAVCLQTTDTCSGADPDKACLRAGGVACTANAQCASGACGGAAPAQVCKAADGEECGSGNNGATCASADATCTTYIDGSPAGDHCLLAAGKTCSPSGASSICRSEWCANGTCGCTVCASGCTYTTIAAAIQAGVADIAVGTGTYTEYNLPLPAGDVLRIRPCGDGPVTIDAQQLGRIMVPVTAGKSVTFEGVTLTNGKVGDGYGGALVVLAGGTLTLADTTVSASQAGWGGGGVGNDGGTLVLTDTTVTGCTVTGSYGAGGGVYSDGANATLTITGGEIASNQTTGFAWGGGICVYSGQGVSLSGVHIHDNSAGIGIGGGINVDTATSVAIEDCRFIANTANFGGGVYVWKTDAAITGGEIKNNTAAKSPGQYGGHGGGLYLLNGNVTLTDVEITGNWAETDGGAVSQRLARGGGVFLGMGTAKVTIAGTTLITGNRSDDEGAGIYIYGGTVPSTRVNTVECAGAAQSCSNPVTGSTGASNCSADANASNTFVGCATACVGGGPGGTSSGTCPA